MWSKRCLSHSVETRYICFVRGVQSEGGPMIIFITQSSSSVLHHMRLACLESREVSNRLCVLHHFVYWHGHRLLEVAQGPVTDGQSPRGIHGQGRHHPNIQGAKLVWRLAHCPAAQRHCGVWVERGHRAAGLLRDGREEGGLVSGQPRGAGGDPVHDLALSTWWSREYSWDV